MPPKQLSKGTMGLKFMNRALPASTPSAASTASSGQSTPAPPPKAASATANATGTGAATTGRTATGPGTGTPSAPRPRDDDDWTRTTSGGRSGARTVIHESSLLSFPLLSTLSARTSASTSSTFTSTTATYSSMPLTAGAISGRRSYGGANVEIEKLNDPSSHQAPAASSTGESKAALKKRLKAERDAAPVSVRRSGGSTLSSAKTGKRTAALDKDKVDGGKRRRTGESDADEMSGDLQWDGGEDTVSLPGAGAGAGGVAAQQGFARPAGFEGARSKGKGRARTVEAGLGDGHTWAQRGETREWDEDKMGDSDDGEDGNGSSAVDDDSEEDSADEVEEFVMRSARRGKGTELDKVKRDEVERAIQQHEERTAKGGKGGKKRR
ncbi:hypothetical protein JCM3770_003199 [Rhodotorula araucariae]